VFSLSARINAKVTDIFLRASLSFVLISNSTLAIAGRCKALDFSACEEKSGDSPDALYELK
jgi:hypothetical protein